MWMIETICIYQRLSGGSHRILALSKDVILLPVCPGGVQKLKHNYTDSAEQSLSSTVTKVTIT